MDNLNAHRPASLHQMFAPAEARRLLERLEIRYTSMHGSRLNGAGIELSALATQGLDPRIPDSTTLTREIAAWEAERNTVRRTVDERFTAPARASNSNGFILRFSPVRHRLKWGMPRAPSLAPSPGAASRPAGREADIPQLRKAPSGRPPAHSSLKPSAGFIRAARKAG